MQSLFRKMSKSYFSRWQGWPQKGDSVPHARGPLRVIRIGCRLAQPGLQQGCNKKYPMDWHNPSTIPHRQNVSIFGIFPGKMSINKALAIGFSSFDPPDFGNLFSHSGEAVPWCLATVHHPRKKPNPLMALWYY